MLHCGRPASQPSVCQGNRAMVSLSLIPRSQFIRLPEKWVWSTAYSIFVQVRWNVGAFFFFNLTFDVIEDCIPLHDLLAKCTLIGQPAVPRTD